jgi:prepilin peptidase CpaA
MMAVFYFMGALGAGDVKALAALGAFFGPWGALQLFLATTLCGGVMALGYLIITRQGAVAWGGLGNLRVAGGGATLPYGLARWGAAVLMVVNGGVW